MYTSMSKLSNSRLEAVAKEVLKVVVVRPVRELEAAHVSEVGAELPVDAGAEFGGADVLLDVPDHLVTLPHVILRGVT